MSLGDILLVYEQFRRLAVRVGFGFMRFTDRLGGYKSIRITRSFRLIRGLKLVFCVNILILRFQLRGFWLESQRVCVLPDVRLVLVGSVLLGGGRNRVGVWVACEVG